MFKYLLMFILLNLTACRGKLDKSQVPITAVSVPIPAPTGMSKSIGKPKLISVRDFLVRGEKASPGWASQVATIVINPVN